MNDVSKCKLYYFPKKNNKKCKKVQEEMLITVILKI